MKLRNNIVWIFLSLFIVSQGAYAVAPSSHQHQMSDESCTHMMSHHDMAQMAQDQGHACDEQMNDHQSCCQSACQCGAGHCQTSLILNENSPLIGHVRETELRLNHVLQFPQQHGLSLYRPPIFS